VSGLEQPHPRTRTTVTGRWLFAVFAIAAGLGAAGGLLWWWSAPRVVLQVVNGRAFPVEYQPGGFIADDGIAAIACIVGGLIIGALVLVVQQTPSREYSRATLGALFVAVTASLIGAVVLWLVGTFLGRVDVAAQIVSVGDGGQFDSALQLRMPGVLLLWPLFAALMVAVVAVSDWIADRWASESGAAKVR
jgi:hypothetical protein